MMVGTKMILFAIVGMLVILGVNFVFYKSLKKTFKDRKLIWLIYIFTNQIWLSYINAK